MMSQRNIYNIMNVIAESYLSSVEQLANTIKDEDKTSKKLSAQAEQDRATAFSILGKSLYKKYEMNGNMDTYAPIGVMYLNFTKSDLMDIFKKWIADDETIDKYTMKLIDAIKKEYSRYEFKLSYNDTISSNIVFRTFDEFCHFIAFMYKQVNKLCKNAPAEYINWKSIISKYKIYIK